MFIYTVSYLKHYQVNISPIELLILTTAFLLLIILSTPSPNEVQQQPVPLSMSLIYKFWYGDAPLWQVFWPYWLILNLLVFAIDTLAKSAIVTVVLWDFSQINLFLISIWWVVSVWRVSDNTRMRSYGSLARVMTIIVMLEFAHRTYIRIVFPRDFFNCSELFLDFSTCF